MDENELIEIIERAERYEEEELKLTGREIESLPGRIGRLKKLKILFLGENCLRMLPKQIGQLRNLEELYVNENRLEALPVQMGKLKKLKVLSLGDNRLRVLPVEIGGLTDLRELQINENKLNTLPAEIGRLRNLEVLNVYGNELSGLPRELGQLRNLRELYISRNELRELPAEISALENLQKLEVDDNKELTLPPVEIVKQGPDAVRNYFKCAETEETSRVYEAKLLIVGEGGVGKTCLMKRLIETDKEIDEKEITTEGIEISRWMIDMDKEKDFRVNFWDFGGQEIYHATHQFFLTKRSLYVFVWTARKDEDLTSFDYWLNVVRLLSDNSRVIVVLNKIDERIKSIDEQSLKERFDNIAGFERVSALEGTGIKGLREKIREEIAQLPHIGDVLPKVWVDIRKRLEGLDKNHISYDEYKGICEEFGLDEDRADFLSQYYHDLGVFLHFMDNAVLREIVFLKPDWATNAVYKVIDTKEVQRNYGEFEFAQLKKIWDDYPEDRYAHLLELMKKFELCFEIPGMWRYIVPELLQPSRPEFEWNYRENMRFEYRYEFMPSGIITRFIVRTHDVLREDICWKNGVVLQWEATEAIIVSERLNRRIRIWIKGEKRRELLAIIRREIDYIHKTLNDPDVKEMIPCICSQCVTAKQPYFYDYETLCRFRTKGKIACEKSTEDVSIEKLLGEYERPEDRKEIRITDIEKWLTKPPFIEQALVKEVILKPKKWYKTIWGIIVLLGIIITIISIFMKISTMVFK